LRSNRYGGWSDGIVCFAELYKEVQKVRQRENAAELEDKFGLHVQTYSKKEKGHLNMTITLLCQLTIYFFINTFIWPLSNYLFGIKIIGLLTKCQFN